MKQKNGKILILSGVMLLLSSVIIPFGVKAVSTTQSAKTPSTTFSSEPVKNNVVSTTTTATKPSAHNGAIQKTGSHVSPESFSGEMYTGIIVAEKKEYKEITDYSSELQEAYERAYENGIISESSIDDANLYKALTNDELANIMIKFHNKILGYERNPDTDGSCTFAMNNDNMLNLCELNLITSSDNIDFNGYTNRAIFGTMLSRALRFRKYEGGTPYYVKHLNALKEAGIMNDINNPENKKELKGYVLRILKLGSEYILNKCNVDPQYQLVCLDPEMDVYVECPEICRPDGILVNDLTETVTFNTDETDKKVVFSGRYKAIKNNISINSIAFENISNIECDYNNTGENYGMEFYLTIDGRTVNTSAGPSFIPGHCLENGIVQFDNNKEIFINKGSSVSIKIEGKNRGNNQPGELKLKTTLGYFDGNYFWEGYKRGEASAYLAPIRIVENKLSIQTSPEQDTVHLKGRYSTLAEFIIKPSKGNSAYLNELELEIDETQIENDNIELIIDGIVQEFTSSNDGKLHIICEPNWLISSEGVPVKVVLIQAPEYEDYMIGTTIKSVNGEPIDKTFLKRFVSALVYISEQENKGNYTKFTLGVEKYDDNYFTNFVCLLTSTGTHAGTCFPGHSSGSYEDGYTFTVNNSVLDQNINFIRYQINSSVMSGWGDNITIEREDYPDYFKTKTGEPWKIYGSTPGETTYGNLTSGQVINAGYTTEMKEAYQFAKSNGITTIHDINKAKINLPLTRIAMAKMLSNYAINVLGQEPDPTKGIVEFDDVTKKLDKQYDNAVTKAYQLGIMGQNIKNNKFRPYAEVTRAEFATALSRLLYGDTYNVTNGKYYIKHLKALEDNGIITKTDPWLKEKRGYVMTMLMRTAE